MMTADIDTLLWIGGWTLALYILTMRLLSRGNQKVLYTVFVLCFFVYNGYGIAYTHGVYSGYGTMYIVFLGTLSAAYVLFLALLRKEVRYAQAGTMGLLKDLFEKPVVVNLAIGTYFCLILFPLIYPEFKLSLLFNPPAPDIAQEFMLRFTRPPDALSKIVQAVSYLVFPFYLISTIYYRRNFLAFTFMIAFPSYVLYCAQSYISRGERGRKK